TRWRGGFRCAACARRPTAAAAFSRSRNSETRRWRGVRSAADSPAPRAAAALARQFDAAAVDAAGLQQLQEIALAAADVEHLGAALDHLGYQEMIAAIMPGVLRRHAGQRQDLLLHAHVSRPPC